MRVALIVKSGHQDSGVGRYARELERGLLQAGCEVVKVYPLVPFPGWFLQAVRTVLGWDLGEFFNTYPLLARYPRADIYHFSSQNLATLLLLCPPRGKTVVTVHDIFPALLDNYPEIRINNHAFDRLFDRMAMSGLRRAGHIICVSTFSKDTLWQHLKPDQMKVSVVLEGVKTGACVARKA
ncbi:MAG: glycosyltransferase [Anaerolineaceae bacterium]|nr:glycosyltransferase [Anaerolineaceae bacterium]